MLLVYQTNDGHEVVALPEPSLVLETPAQVENQVVEPEIRDDETGELTREAVLQLVEIAPAAYRKQTTEEVASQIISVGGLPIDGDTPHIIVSSTDAAYAVSPTRWSVDFANKAIAIQPDVITQTCVSEAKATVAAHAQSLTESIRGPVPDDEIASWPSKEIAARAIIAGTATSEQTAMIDGEAQLTGESVQVLAAKIVTNADAYGQIVGLVAGQRRKTFAEIDALTVGTATRDQLAVVLATAEAQAAALLAQVQAS